MGSAIQDNVNRSELKYLLLLSETTYKLRVIIVLVALVSSVDFDGLIIRRKMELNSINTLWFSHNNCRTYNNIQRIKMQHALLLLSTYCFKVL